MKLKTTAEIPIFLVVIYLLLFASNNYISKILSGNGNFTFALILELSVYLIPCLFYSLLKKRIYFVKNKPNKINNFGIIISASLLIVFLGILYSVLLHILNIQVPISDTVFLTDKNVILSIVCLIFFPALLEEYLFRGILINEYDKFGRIVAVLFSSICFAIFHMSFSNFLFYFVCGIILAIVTYITNSLFSAFIVHLIYNLFIVFGQKYITNLITNFDNSSFVAVISLICILLSVFGFLTALDRYYQKLAYSAKYEESNSVKNKMLQNSAEVFLSPYFLILVLIFTATTFNII